MKRLLLPALSAFLCALFSCKKPGTDSRPYLKSDSTTLTLGGYPGALDSFTVRASLSWKASTSASWLSLSDTLTGGEKKIFLRALEINATGADRTATINIQPVDQPDIAPLTLQVRQRAFSLGILFNKTFGFDRHDYFSSMALTPDGGLVLTGELYRTDPQDGQYADKEVPLLKLNAQGMVQWQRAFGDGQFDGGRAVLATPEGGYAVAGTTGVNNGNTNGRKGMSDFWMVKTDALGNPQWEKILGGSSFEQASCLALTPDGGYVLAGYTYSNDGDVTGKHGSTGMMDMWVVRLDSRGNLIWQKALGGSGHEEAHSVIAVPGGYLVAGSSSSGDGDVSPVKGVSDGWVVKLSESGSILWEKTFGGTGLEKIFCIAPTADRNFILAGYSSSADGEFAGGKGAGTYNGWVLKMDGSGNKLWQKTFGGTEWDEFRSVAAAPDGGFLLSGVSESGDGDLPANKGMKDNWVVKLGASGQLLWQRSLGGGGNDYGYLVLPAADGAVWLGGGSWSDNGDVPGNKGGQDAWLLKLQEQ
ncbi:BACON domain-containing protein [Paraflavisolibacter sp. H34]|uniref:BACON domain-containing protein n=1 Tax=Huijunlia imazamoxiresistens TaxID=3127457 RepID=UPI0030184B52